MARVAELREGVLILAGPTVPQPLDDVCLVCAECATELPGAQWSVERSQEVPDGSEPMSDADALEALAAELNEPGECNGADLGEMAGRLLSRTGRRIPDQPDDEGIWG